MVREVIDSLGMNYRNLFVINDYDENDYESDIELIDVWNKKMKLNFLYGFYIIFLFFFIYGFMELGL